MSDEPVLRPEEVQGVLSGTGAVADAPAVQPYSLREPMAIPPAALGEARRTMTRLVEVLNDALGNGDEVELGLDDLQQQTADAALAALPRPPWIAGLQRGTNGGIVLALHPLVGLALVDLALGGPGTPPEEPRGPTPLESRVLQRMLAAAAPRLGTVLAESFAPAAGPTGELPPTVATAGETLAVGLLRFKIGEGHHASLLLVTASLLVPAESEPRARDRAGRPGPLAKLLERAQVEVRPVLPAGSVSINDMVSARAGNVLRLDAPEDALFELRAGGRPVAHGRIVNDDAGCGFAVSRTCRRVPQAERKEHDE